MSLLLQLLHVKRMCRYNISNMVFPVLFRQSLFPLSHTEFNSCPTLNVHQTRTCMEWIAVKTGILSKCLSGNVGEEAMDGSFNSADWISFGYFRRMRALYRQRCWFIVYIFRYNLSRWRMLNFCCRFRKSDTLPAFVLVYVGHTFDSVYWFRFGRSVNTCITRF